MKKGKMLSRLYRNNSLLYYSLKAVQATHTATCPLSKRKAAEKSSSPTEGEEVDCGGADTTGGAATSGGPPSSSGLKRALESGKCRLSFMPEEWFLFFYSKTGVTGPYLFGLNVMNYMISKEIFVMEHEYYLGLSELVCAYLIMKHLAPIIAADLDKKVDDVVADLQKGRDDEIKFFEDSIKQNEDAQWRAEGQKFLMDAKKENILMQLEAVYRERFMKVHKQVKGRMDYHLKIHKAKARIQQKWMIAWILSNVRKSITPEIEKRALDQAIADLAAVASRAH